MEAHAKSQTKRSLAISTIRMIFIVMITGIGFGILMSIVSNGFVSGVDYLFNARHHLDFLDFSLAGSTYSLSPLIALPCASSIVNTPEE